MFHGTITLCVYLYCFLLKIIIIYSLFIIFLLLFLDGSPISCKVFVDNRGLRIYTLLLNTFIADIQVVLKVLGLFYNIAEVPHLRETLFRHNIVTAVR